MQKKVLSIAVFSLMATALLVALPGTAQSLDDLDPVVRSAAADVFTRDCSLSGSVSYSTNGLPGLGSAEGRRAGLSCQRTDMLSGGGDPFVTDADGAVVNATADAGAYAAASLPANAPSASIERRWARAQAAVLAVRDGFAIVPGGPSEAFNRIQSCLNGALETNQGNAVLGVALDCSEETVRRSVADLIAPGFYIQFGNLVSFGCTEMHAQAHGGSTVEARWAGALAYVSACGPDLAATAAEGGEIGFAAVAPLAAAGGGAGSGDNVDLANAYAAGLADANSVSTDATGNPSTASLGNLFQFSLSNFGSTAAFTAHAPMARAFGGSGEIRINIAGSSAGDLPLIGTVLLRD